MMQSSSLMRLALRRGGLFVRPMATMTAASQKHFPNWLHLKAYAPHKQRTETTDRIANSISKSGGYLTHSTLLSDMATTLVLEDVDPHHLEPFVQAIEEIEGFDFELDSKEQLKKCFEMVHQVDDDVKHKAQHITTFQQTLRDMERQGMIQGDAHQEFVQKCHQFASELAHKNAVEADTSSLPPTIHAIIQLTWKDVPGKAKNIPFGERKDEHGGTVHFSHQH